MIPWSGNPLKELLSGLVGLIARRRRAARALWRICGRFRAGAGLSDLRRGIHCARRKRMVLTLMTGFVLLQGRADEFSELTARESLTPEALVEHFADFEFELRDARQTPETFLARKSGDCDDFAALAKTILSERGYSTKLVVVRMEKQTHMICFVTEARGYLDYNLRASAQPITPSDGSLEDIADKVSAYFQSTWTMASEIEYENGRPLYLDSVFQ